MALASILRENESERERARVKVREREREREREKDTYYDTLLKIYINICNYEQVHGSMGFTIYIVTKQIRTNHAIN